MSKRHIARAAAAAVTLAVAAVASADDLYWKGTDGSLDSPNYFDATTSTDGVGAGNADSLYIGAASNLTEVSNLTVGRVIVGHTGTSTAGVTGAPALAGAGNVQITGGTFITTSTVPVAPPAGTASPDSSLIIGYSANGSFSISNAAVTASDTVVVGFSATDATINASLAVNAGGSLTVSKGGLQLGGNGSSTVTGAGGSLTVNGGTLSIVDPAGTSTPTSDLVIGVWNKSTFTQTGGITSVVDETFVGRRNADFTSFALSGGTFNTRMFHVADTSGSGRIDDTSATITDANLNVTSTTDIGAGNSRRASLTIGHGANVTGGGAFNVAGGDAVDTTVTIGSTANVSFTGSMSIGGGNSNRTNVTITDSATFKSGAINVGNSATGSTAAATSLTISGNAAVTGTGGLVLGNGATTNGTTVTIKDNATVNLANGLTVGLNADPNVVLNVGNNANITLATGGSATVHFFVGRGTSTTTFNMTGGTITSPNLVLIGSPQTGSGPAIATVNHSAGTINAGTSASSANRGFKVADTVSTTTYNLSGTGAINVANGVMIVGRGGTGTMNQTGGSVTASGGLYVGEAEASATFGTGTYNISAGSITASVPTGSTANAFAIGKTTTGTFRVIGGDSTINVTGNMLVNTVPAADPNPARVGTLAYQLQAGESLTEINVTGTATFSAGSVLSLDLNGVTPPVSSYDLLTAIDIIDSGLTFSGPAGWNYRIVTGGAGELLQAFTTPLIVHNPGDANNDGIVDQLDLNVVNGNWQVNSNVWENGDLTGDGIVDQLDLNQVNANWQATYAHAPAGIAAVPEPTTLGLLAAGTLPLLGRRRRRTAR